MPDPMDQSLAQAGGITKALLNALDTIQQYVAASQVGPDGKPTGTAVYMHMAAGYPIDPKMYANAWTPGGGDSGSKFSDDGTFVTPAATPAASTGAPAAPAGSITPPPKPGTDPQLQNSIQNAWFTSQLVDNMLEITQNGVATAWPDHRASIEYYTVLEGMQPVATGQPAQDVLDAVAAAQKVLYVMDDKGNPIGYTPVYAQYRHNETAWQNAIAAQATAYAQAMADPVLGQTWPVSSASYANAVQQALDDFNGMGRRQVEDALNTLATVGGNAIAALVAQAHKLYDAYTIQLAGSVSVGTQWSYINPISWWDHTDDSFGIQKITATSQSYDAGGGSGSSSFANNWYNQQSSSNSGSVGVSCGLWGGSANASHDDASNAFADHSGNSGWSHFSDSASSATVTCEFFLASIERPWFLGDLLHMDGWYLVGHDKNSVSDGTVAGGMKDDSKILPMLPKGFLIMRNVSITANDWGQAGDAFNTAQGNTSGSGQSSSTSVGVSASYLFANASYQHGDQQSSGAFGTDASSNTGWSFQSDGKGGTLTLTGSQIIGWVGEIQPASPKLDDPQQKAKEDAAAAAAKKDTKTTDTSTTTPAPGAPGTPPAQPIVPPAARMPAPADTNQPVG